MIYDYGNGLYGIDAHYEGEGNVQVFLLKSGGEAAIIETAHNASLPHLLAAMDELGVSRESVRYVCVTHVHLDHAGGAGAYMREFPNATLVVHPRGARHMIDPAKLVEGVKAVYGPEETARLYGEIIPAPAERVHAAEDGEALPLSETALRCFDAPGHAKHHMIFFDEKSRALFAGDGFGISYMCMEGSRGRWAVPTASPVQFDPEAMKRTMEHIVALAPSAIYLTHFGRVTEIREIAESLAAAVDKFVEIALDTKGEPAALESRLVELHRELIRENGQEARAEEIERALSIDVRLNVKGLACWYGQGRAKGRAD